MKKMPEQDKILITRPQHQAGPLSQSIISAGGSVLQFPTLAILPLELPSLAQTELQQYDMIIFISPNAVEYGLKHILSSYQNPLPDNLLLATVGQGSARVLKKILGKEPDIVPQENFNSEGLLATHAMQEVNNKHILIIRGNTGREYLKQTLETRGATVKYLSVYKRTRPETPTAELEQYLQNKQIAAIVITSAESLKNLIEMVPNSVRKQILKVPLLLINQRLVELAKIAGFGNNLWVTAKASDDSIIETLKENKLLS